MNRVNTYSIIDLETLGPIGKGARRNGCLSHGEREREPQLPLLVLKHIAAPFVRDEAGQRGGDEAEQLLKNSPSRNTTDEMGT